jgi:hypothetical protein
VLLFTSTKEIRRTTMDNTRALLFLVLISIFFSNSVFSQEEVVTTSVPFLLINPSADANGQGNASISRIADDPFAIILNPAQLGFSDKRINAVFAFYPTKTQWLPGFGLDDLTLNSRVVSAGINLERLIAIPLSIGLAQSRVDFNLGTLIRTGANMDTLGFYNPYEYAEANSIGVGVDLGIRFAFGITVRKIVSYLVPPGAADGAEAISAKAWSYDYGLLLQLPLSEFIKKAPEAVPGVTPIFDISIGTVLSNVGGKITYIDPSQGDPLPRSISLGTTLDFGLVSSHIGLKFFALSWSRQSDNLLVGRDSLSSYYRGGFGDIDFTQNIIMGKRTTRTDLSQGWELGMAETAFARGGSFKGTGSRFYTTAGFGLRTTGLFKILKEKLRENTVWSFIVSHFDFRYDHSELETSGLDSPLANTKFSSIALKVSF